MRLFRARVQDTDMSQLSEAKYKGTIQTVHSAQRTSSCDLSSVPRPARKGALPTSLYEADGIPWTRFAKG